MPGYEEWATLFQTARVKPAVVFSAPLNGYNFYSRHGTSFDCRLTVIDRPAENHEAASNEPTNNERRPDRDTGRPVESAEGTPSRTQTAGTAQGDETGSGPSHNPEGSKEERAAEGTSNTRMGSPGAAQVRGSGPRRSGRVQTGPRRVPDLAPGYDPDADRDRSPDVSGPVASDGGCTAPEAELPADAAKSR